MAPAPRAALALLAGVTCGLLVAACLICPLDFVVLVGGSLVRPRDASLMVWGSGVLTALALTALVVLRPRFRPARRRSAAAVVGALVAAGLVAAGAWCVGAAVLIDGLAALGPDSWTVLRPQAGRGCVLVVHEHGALRSSDGRVYAVDRSGFGRPVAAWGADEIQLPVRDGSFSLTWAGQVGSLALRGSQEIWPDRLTVPCPPR